jgi:hypothetical protein
LLCVAFILCVSVPCRRGLRRLIVILFSLPRPVVSPPTSELRTLGIPPLSVTAITDHPLTAYPYRTRINALRTSGEPMAKDVNGKTEMFRDLLHGSKRSLCWRCYVISVLGSWHGANIQKTIEK